MPPLQTERTEQIAQTENAHAPALAKVLRYALIAFFLAVVASVVVSVVRVSGELVSPADVAPALPRVQEYLDKAGNRITESEYRVEVGYEAAKTKGITRHKDCEDMPSLDEVNGCHRFVTERKRIGPYIPQRDFTSGKTSAQCREEVNAYFGPLIEDMRERGDDGAASVWTTKRWMPELEQCPNYDNLRILKVVHEPASRLSALMAKAERGETITDQDRLVVTRDLAGVLEYPDHPERSAYIERSARFFRIADGLEKPAVPQPLASSCEEFQAKLDDLDEAENRAVAEARALKSSRGLIVDGKRWDALNKSRLENLTARHRYAEGAKAAGCVMAVAR